MKQIVAIHFSPGILEDPQDSQF